MDKAAKRKDLMDNIKTRLNSNSYNVTRHFRKNEKDLREKVKFFEKKIATGQMRDYMMPRYQQAQALLAKIEGLRPANMPAVPKVPRVVTQVEPIVAPNRPIVTNAMIDVPKIRSLTAKANSGVARRSPVKKTVRIRNAVPKPSRAHTEVIENAFLLQAIDEVLPLPELYDPYTGRKYAPEESPIEDIERAYFMLKKIRADTWRRAATLRKRSMKKTAPTANTTVI